MRIRKQKPNEHGRIKTTEVTRHRPDPDYPGYCWCGLSTDRCPHVAANELDTQGGQKEHDSRQELGLRN
jgi:hypothetical protein